MCNCFVRSDFQKSGGIDEMKIFHFQFIFFFFLLLYNLSFGSYFCAFSDLSGMIWLCRLNLINGNFVFMLTSYMPSDRIISRECSRTERAWHTYTLMTLSNMCTKIGFVAVQSVAVQALQFFSCHRHHHHSSTRILKFIRKKK